MLAEGHAAAPVVFCDADGGYLRKSNFYRRSFLRILERVGCRVAVRIEAFHEAGEQVTTETALVGVVTAATVDKFTVQVAAKKHHFAIAKDARITLDGKRCEPTDLHAGQHAKVAWQNEGEFPRITFHGLRHTCASLLLLAGENPKVVSERLGHKSVQTTLTIYAHVMPGMAAAEKLEASLRLATIRLQSGS